MTMLSISLRILVVLILVILILVYFFQSKLLFFPLKLEKDFAFEFSLPHEEKFISYNNEIVHGLMFKAKNPKARIIAFHGNRGALNTWGQIGVDLSHKLQGDVLILDYPGYGKSSAELPLSEKALYQSAEAAFDEFIATTDKTLPIIVYGRSLGSAVASHLAAAKSVQALILETPYTSMKAMASHVFPYLPSFLVRYDLDNEKNIKDLNIPILIIHGTQDSVVPFTHASSLAKQKPNAEFISIEGGAHNDLASYPLYWRAVEKFAAKVSL